MEVYCQLRMPRRANKSGGVVETFWQLTDIIVTNNLEFLIFESEITRISKSRAFQKDMLRL